MRTTPPGHIAQSTPPAVPDADRAAGENVREDVRVVQAIYEEGLNRHTRPRSGLATFVGIASIVAAGLTLFFVAGKIMFLAVAVGIMSTPEMATGTGNMFNAPTAPAAVTVVPGVEPGQSANIIGFNDAEVTAVMTALNDTLPLDGDESARTADLVREHGPKMFALRGDDLTPAAAGATIKDAERTDRQARFDLADGTLFVMPRESIYTDSNFTTYEVTQMAEETYDYGGFGAYGNFGEIEDVDVDRIVARVDELGGPLTDAQEQALRRDAVDTNVGLIDPWFAMNTNYADQILEVRRTADEGVEVFSSQGIWRADADGAATFADTAGFPATSRGKTAANLAIAGEAGALLLSGLLLAAGIQTLRYRPSGRRLHVLHAVLKVGFVLFAGIGWYMLLDEWPGNDAGWAVVMTILLLGGGLVWAILSALAVLVPPLGPGLKHA